MCERRRYGAADQSEDVRTAARADWPLGIGAAIYEEVKIKDGLVLNPNFADYRVPSVGEVPTMTI